MGTAAQKAVSVVGQDALVEVSSSQLLALPLHFILKQSDINHACKMYVPLQIIVQNLQAAIHVLCMGDACSMGTCLRHDALGIVRRNSFARYSA